MTGKTSSLPNNKALYQWVCVACSVASGGFLWGYEASGQGYFLALSVVFGFAALINALRAVRDGG